MWGRESIKILKADVKDSMTQNWGIWCHAGSTEEQQSVDQCTPYALLPLPSS